jgi:hypothetical protein
MARLPSEIETRRLALIASENGVRVIRTTSGYVCRGWETSAGDPGRLLDAHWVIQAIRHGWLVPIGPLRGDGLADHYSTRSATL